MVQRAQQLRRETWTYEKISFDGSSEIELPADDSWPTASTFWPELLTIISAVALLLAGLIGATSLLDGASPGVSTETAIPREAPYFASVADALYSTDGMMAAREPRPPTQFTTAADAVYGQGSLSVIQDLLLAERTTR